MAATITCGSSSWAFATPNPALTSSTGGAGRHLGQRIRLHAAEIAGQQLGSQRLAAGGVDALPDDHEGQIRADGTSMPVFRAKDRLHEGILLMGFIKRPGSSQKPGPVSVNEVAL